MHRKLNMDFGGLVIDKSFIETCNFLRSHAIRHDQQNKERRARQIRNTYQFSGTGTTKKDKIKNVIALINELQIQDSVDSDDELNTPKLSKTAVVCKLAQ
jgi:signal transduction histidine kinase